MKVYQIFIDGKPYQGEDIERTYRLGGGSMAGSFHSYTGHESNLLKIGRKGEPAQKLHAQVGLKNAIDRMAQQIQDGVLTCRRIVIEVSDEPLSMALPKRQSSSCAQSR